MPAMPLRLYALPPLLSCSMLFIACPLLSHSLAYAGALRHLPGGREFYHAGAVADAMICCCSRRRSSNSSIHVHGSEDGEGGSIGKGSMRGPGPPLPHNSPMSNRQGLPYSYNNSMRRDSSLIR